MFTTKYSFRGRKELNYLKVQMCSNDDNPQKPVSNYSSLISPADRSNHNFEFSKRNYCPRVNNFNKESKNSVNPNFNYYSSNNLPSTISPRTNLLTMMVYTESDLKSSHECFNKMVYSMKNDTLSYQRTSPKCHLSYGGNTSYSVNYKECQDNKFNMNVNYPRNANSTKSNSPADSPEEAYKDKLTFIKKPSNKAVNNNNDEYNAKKQGQFVERQGDWICMRCKNLNFSFRVVCNRCKIPKSDSENIYDDHVNNLMKLKTTNEPLSLQQPQPIFVNQNNYLHINHELYTPVIQNLSLFYMFNNYENPYMNNPMN